MDWTETTTSKPGLLLWLSCFNMSQMCLCIHKCNHWHLLFYQSAASNGDPLHSTAPLPATVFPRHAPHLGLRQRALLLRDPAQQEHAEEVLVYKHVLYMFKPSSECITHSQHDTLSELLQNAWTPRVMSVRTQGRSAPLLMAGLILN